MSWKTLRDRKQALKSMRTEQIKFTRFHYSFFFAYSLLSGFIHDTNDAIYTAQKLEMLRK